MIKYIIYKKHLLITWHSLFCDDFCFENKKLNWFFHFEKHNDGWYYVCVLGFEISFRLK